MDPRTPHFETLVELLSIRAATAPDHVLFTFLLDGDLSEATRTCAELDREARAIASALQSVTAARDRVLLLFPPGLDYISGFFGALYAGTIPVPAYPPDPTRIARALPRLIGIVRDARPSVVLTTKAVMSLSAGLVAQTAELRGMKWMAIDADAGDPLAWRPPVVRADDIAFLQYTSGSTMTPRGVMVTHENILFNQKVINQSFRCTVQSSAVCWLPPYHDMGLIGGILPPLVLPAHAVLMSPLAFLQKPLRWLQGISRYGATISGGPNFAYDLCVRKIDEEQRKTLDLSKWDVAFCGAEPIRAGTIERFTEAFGACGFRPETFYPVYGLAEATLLVAGGRKGGRPVIRTFDRAALRQRRVVPVASSHPEATPLVSCGTSLGDLALIVDPDGGAVCPDGDVGELWVSGSSVARGYWDRPEDTEAVFRAALPGRPEAFLRTGDLGMKSDGELYLTGRLRDLIIIRGLNLHPQDIEHSVERASPHIRPGCSAAFAVEENGESRLVVVAELSADDVDRDEIRRAIRRAVGDEHEVIASAIAFAPRGSIPKTSSGKLQRHLCRESYLAGEWGAPVADPPAASAAPANGAANVANGAASGAANGAANGAASGIAEELVAWLRDYAGRRINSRLMDERRSIPPHVVLDLGNRGLLGMQVPVEHGGLALPYRGVMRVVEQLAAVDLSLAIFVGNNNFLGIRPIERFGSPALKQAHLRDLATGRELAAFALTETAAGSNPRAIQSRATSDGAGSHRLTGTKVWSGSAGWAGIVNVFAHSIDERGRPQGISAFSVRQEQPGVHVGPEALTMGMRGMVQSTMFFDDVELAADCQLGGTGDGMIVAQDAMMICRLGMAAISVGGIKRCVQLALRYASRREIGTGRLLDNPVALAWLGEITAGAAAVEALVARTASLLDAGRPVPPEIFSACKIAGPELLWRAADALAQLTGGRGYMEANQVPQILRDARGFRVFEGPSETMQMYLGARVLSEPAALQGFLRGELACPEAADEMREALDALPRSAGARAFSDRLASSWWSQYRAGAVASAAILRAAAAWHHREAGTMESERARAWAEAHFAQIAASLAAERSPWQAALVDNPSSLVDRVADAYAHAIGDIDQLLPGEETECDELLLGHRGHRDRVAAARPVERAPLGHGSLGTPAPAGENQLAATPAPAGENQPRAAVISDWIARWIAGRVGLDVGEIDRTQPFSAYGMDSVLGVDLANDLSAFVQLPLSVTMAWDYPTIERLAQHLAEAAPAGGDGAVEALLDEAKRMFDESAERRVDQPRSESWGR
jgi:acyl-CoA synthetase (AMP-forming)/AMP-acid ligase II/alkylation response protein AidB-like acyl-CoA dehydrogenase/acyl carrier protein